MTEATEPDGFPARDCGIVVAEPQGRRTRHEIADPHLGRAPVALVETTPVVDADAACIDPGCAVEGRCPEEGR